MDKITVILNVVNTGEFVNIYAEKLAVFFKCEYIAVRIYARRVNLDVYKRQLYACLFCMDIFPRKQFCRSRSAVK